MKKILIIDYDQNSLSTLQGVFAGRGYQVVTAADGQTGWDKYNKECPDLVLMEAMLPKVHGFELCQRITSERSTAATVFIMTGVYKDRVYRTEALRTYGASEYFEKPLKMTELIASVEAVLGKPEIPAAAPAPVAAPPARDIPPEPASAEARRREKPRSDDSLFALPEDLDRLSRETPKGRKPAPARPDPEAEQRFEAIADQLLKTVIVESSTPKTVSPKPGGGNGNGNGNGKGGAEIDQFLRSALAGLDLSKEKVKAAKPAPRPAPPVMGRPAPPAAPARRAAAEIKPVPPAPHAPVGEKPLPASATGDMKNTLTPGDPGSDVSPFFTPEARRPFAPAEKKAATVAPHHEVPKPEPVRPAPVHREAAKPAPDAGIFQDVALPAEKKGFPKALVIALGIVAVAAIGFILLRPKRPAPVPPAPQETAAPMTSNDVNPPVEEAAPPVVKPAPAKQKAQPQAKPAEPTGASAILPAQTQTTSLPLPGTSPGGRVSDGPAPSGSNTQAAVTEAPKTDDTAAPRVKTGAETSQGQASETAPPLDPAPAPASTAAAPVQVNEGDLVELGSVTELPKLVKKIEPIYPQAAQRVGREGNITVNALIDEKGNVIDTGILRGVQDDKGLGRAAETAVRRWKFQPARKNGVAVKVWKPFVIAFKADANAAK